jgi:UDP-N-acetylmuramate-alanine ligase
LEIARLGAVYRKLSPYLGNPDEVYLVQSVERQKLFLCSRQIVLDSFDSSTSRFGVGIRENSYRTPPGIHRIVEKIGGDAPDGRIFRSREDTGLDWDRHSVEDSLILTRILRLEGLEQGINKGPGVDTYDRFVYIHGTNREDLIGTPHSSGCLCLRNIDIIRLFDLVYEGALLFIDPPPLPVGNVACRTLHFAGIFGTGMSALAQYLRFQGLAVTGSDRLNDSEDTAPMKAGLERLGCSIAGQDGSGISDETDALCLSTAIEESNPDLAAARARGIPVVHRSDLLAAIIASRRSIAVAGTSGKSTVTAMIFEFLTNCGKSPSLISGAPLVRLEREGLIGNAYSGASDLLVVEADESDGTLVKYEPEMSVILNISKDHKGIDEIRDLFATLISRSRWTASNGDDPILASLPADIRFGKSGVATWRADGEKFSSRSVTIIRDGLEYELPLPGKHNLENLMAALCVCEHLGCGGEALAGGTKTFEGVARRFTIFNAARGIHVVDDFAHNPAKIEAAVNAARGLSERIIAVYQPHGFGPTRFLRDEYIRTMRSVFKPGDSLFLLPIYYAGGTARMDISSADIIAGLGDVPFTAQAVKDRDQLLLLLRAAVNHNDCVIVMGARDPSLPALVQKIVALFQGTA